MGELQPVEQVLAELALLDTLLQVLVGRGHEAHVRANRFRVAHRRVLPFLQDAQQLALDLEGEVADLVEKQRAAGGLAQIPHLVLVRPVKAPLT